MPHEKEDKVSTEDEVLSLTKRVEIIEERLGIDPAAVVADQAASAAAGADAHVGNVQSDVPAPAEPGSVEDALTAANAAAGEGETQQALDHVNNALQKWPDDEDLLAAKSELESQVAAEAAESEPS